jgi:hypothetical protein
VYRVGLGATVEMKCTIPFGALRDRYSVQWFKGNTSAITNSTSSYISVNESSGALVISGVKVSDASEGYYCKVTVNRTVNTTDADAGVNRQGSTISLHVLGECMPAQLHAALYGCPID